MCLPRHRPVASLHIFCLQTYNCLHFVLYVLVSLLYLLSSVYLRVDNNCNCSKILIVWNMYTRRGQMRKATDAKQRARLQIIAFFYKRQKNKFKEDELSV